MHFFEFKSFLALKGWVYITWLLVWNIVFGIAIYFNGGLGPVANPISACISAIALVGTSIFCFCLVYSSEFQLKVVHPKRKKDFGEGSFIFVGSITLIMGIVSMLDGFIS